MPKPRTHNPADISARFREHFGGAARTYRAPGRVNLIGEHTDYNDGFVLPAAIDLFCWVAAATRDDRRLVVFAENFGEQAEIDLKAANAGPKGWASYPLGVAWALQKAGHQLRGCNLYIAGDVPLGSGLSSSAAIEVATAIALLDLSEIQIDRKTLALLCQRAENEYVDARCGVMDKFIACYGQAGHAMLLDCRSLETRAIPLPRRISLVVCNTMVKHELAASEYNARRAECEEGVRLLQVNQPSIKSLRDVTSAQLELQCDRLPKRIYKRCRHVVTENERVLRAAGSLESGDLRDVSQLMADSHESLRSDFQVSCRELDLLVEIAGAQSGVWGSRMTGGGFGGCTINLVEQQAVTLFAATVGPKYQEATGLWPETYCLEAARGGGRVVDPG